jgi:hypothetical protein
VPRYHFVVCEPDHTHDDPDGIQLPSAVNIAKLPELFAKGWIRCAPLARILGPFRRQLKMRLAVD